MGTPRASRPLTAEDWDLEAEETSEIRCINVSPFPARLEFATVPGSRPRRHVIRPGQGLYIEHGYAAPYVGTAGKQMPPTILALAEREAWPGRREQNAEGKWVWIIKPGPRLPQIVPESDAKEWRARWDAAMRQAEQDEQAPLRLKLERRDGTQINVDVDADVDTVKPARPMRARLDEEDLTTGPQDEPPPEHDDPLDPVELPAAPASEPPPDVPLRRGNGRKDRG